MVNTSATSTPATATEAAPPPVTARPGVIFLRSLRDSAPGIVAWGMGYSTLLVLIVFLYPILEENNMLMSVLSGLGVLDRFMANLDVDPSVLNTFHAYLALEALSWGPLVLAVYAIPQSIRAVMGEEERGTLDLLMSTPLPRWQLFVEKALSIIVAVMMILSVMWVALVISTALVDGSDLSVKQATFGIWHILPMVLVVTAFTLMLSVLLRNPRTVGGVAALALLTSFFVSSLSNSVDSPLVDFLRQFSIFSYYSSIVAMERGPALHTELGLLLVAVAMLLVALVAFNRRDLGV